MKGKNAIFLDVYRGISTWRSNTVSYIMNEYTNIWNLKTLGTCLLSQTLMDSFREKSKNDE